MFNPTIRDSFLGEFDNIFSIRKPRSSISVYDNQTTPMANISKDDNGYLVALAAPGLSRGDFDIEISDDIITISTENNFKNENSVRQEYSYHKFSRSWALPENASVDNITAEYTAGILNLNIPVNEVIINKTKKIEVN